MPEENENANGELNVMATFPSDMHRMAARDLAREAGVPVEVWVTACLSVCLEERLTGLGGKAAIWKRVEARIELWRRNAKARYPDPPAPPA